MLLPTERSSTDMKVLLVDPDPASRDALRQAFAGAGDQVRGVTTTADGSRQLAEFHPDAVVAALDFSEEELARLFDEILRLDPRRALYALTDAGRLEDGVRAMTRGAHDFLWRPVSSGRVFLLRARLEARRTREGGLEEMRLRLARSEIATSLAGQSPRWKATLASIEREAAAETAVLLTGEAGTEKEAAARALHRLSRRGSEPFLTVPAGSGIPADGGSGGTLFLPDIGRTSPRDQRDLVAEL